MRIYRQDKKLPQLWWGKNNRFQLWPKHGSFGISWSSSALMIHLYFVTFFMKMKEHMEICSDDEYYYFRFQFVDDMLWWNFMCCDTYSRNKSWRDKTFWMPWGWDHRLTQILDKNAKVLFQEDAVEDRKIRKDRAKSMDKDELFSLWRVQNEAKNKAEKDGAVSIEFTYKMRGEDIKCSGYAFYSYRLWLLRIFPSWFKLKIPGMYREHHSVNFHFYEEFGPERGSWKGGIMECSENIGGFFDIYMDVHKGLKALCARDRIKVELGELMILGAPAFVGTIPVDTPKEEVAVCAEEK